MTVTNPDIRPASLVNGFNVDGSNLLAETTGDAPTIPLQVVVADSVFLINPQQTTPIASEDEKETPSLIPPTYAESNDFAHNGDASEDDAATSADDTPLVILPDDEYDGLFTNLNGSLMDELLTV